MLDLNSHQSIYMRDNPAQKKFLHTKTIPFDFATYTPTEINQLVVHMRAIMRRARGVGLSANQIGLPFRMFVAETPTENGGYKFYAIFNPTIEKIGDRKVKLEEGCLSVPRIYGAVERSKELTIKGFAKTGKPVKIKAWGLLAHIFQHEIDHLDGHLFVDKAENLHETKQVA